MHGYYSRQHGAPKKKHACSSLTVTKEKKKSHQYDGILSNAELYFEFIIHAMFSSATVKLNPKPELK